MEILSIVLYLTSDRRRSEKNLTIERNDTAAGLMVFNNFFVVQFDLVRRMVIVNGCADEENCVEKIFIFA